MKILRTSGFELAYHSAVLGSNTKYTIFAFSMCGQFCATYMCHCIEKRTKIYKKETEYGPNFKIQSGKDWKNRAK